MKLINSVDRLRCAVDHPQHDLGMYVEELPEITLHTGNNEMLRVTPDGFYVRGVKVPADDKEAAAVYAAFKEFLVWSQLTR